MPSVDPAPGRDALAHLARNWNARAAQLERAGVPEISRVERAEVLRECACQLLGLLDPAMRPDVFSRIGSREEQE